MEDRKKRTEIASMGEFGLIKHLTENLPDPNESTLKGVGDDAAILNYNNGKRVLVTTDLLMEGVHFNLAYCPLKHLGYKSAVVNFSDIYAMNGTPKQITVSLAFSKKFAVEDIDELYAGIRIACEQYGVDIIGGDTSSSLTGLAISITCIGEADPDKVVCRNTAGSTDLICVTGDLGAAYMGLLFLERENKVFMQTGLRPDSDDADFAAKSYIIQRQLKPEARKDIIEALARINVVPTSMMDISDGLSSELLHICKQSNVGCRIYEDRLPIDYQTAVMAEEVNMNVSTVALHGGEDYELLFTVPLEMNDVFQNLKGIKVIGHTTKPELGCCLIGRDGLEHNIVAQGWNAFPEKEESNDNDEAEDDSELKS
ncbi:MAG: thiamine-phosphate kinase [Paludibacteraceae bacterium]|nr:thiamine-phosphate kinase [Paludibacteraceae bacterium]